MIAVGTLCKRKHNTDSGGSLRRKNGKGSCIICEAEWFSINKGRYAGYKKQWAQDNPDKVAANTNKWKQANILKDTEQRRTWRLNNPDKVTVARKNWDVRNKHKKRSSCARRRATKLKATPSWANNFFIEEIYDLAKLREKYTGIKWHVDHIVPLKNSLVCGLHVEYNMQVIPAKDNLSKGNRFWPDMPE